MSGAGKLLRDNDKALSATHDWPTGGAGQMFRAGMSARAAASPFRPAVRHIVCDGPDGVALWCTGGKAKDGNQIWGSYCRECARLWREDQEQYGEDATGPECQNYPVRSKDHRFEAGVCTQCGIEQHPPAQERAHV